MKDLINDYFVFFLFFFSSCYRDMVIEKGTLSYSETKSIIETRQF